MAEVHRAQWGTWRHALHALTVARDEDWPVRSSADPRRFEAQVFDRYGGGDGDAAQRLAVQLAPVAQALDAASRGPFVELPESMARELFVTATCGKPYSYRPPGRKHATRLRTEISIGELAKIMDLETGRAVAIVRSMGQDFERILISKGLVSHETNWERETMGEEQLDTLKGWKEIAAFIGLSQQAAMGARYWDPPIPIIQFGGRVEAHKDALIAWKLSGPKFGKRP